MWSIKPSTSACYHSNILGSTLELLSHSDNWEMESSYFPTDIFMHIKNSIWFDLKYFGSWLNLQVFGDSFSVFI